MNNNTNNTNMEENNNKVDAPVIINNITDENVEANNSSITNINQKVGSVDAGGIGVVSEVTVPAGQINTASSLETTITPSTDTTPLKDGTITPPIDVEKIVDSVTPEPKKKSVNSIIVLGVIFLIIVGVVLAIVTYINGANQLVCTANEGKITITYDSKTLRGYVANGIRYDFEGQKKIAEEIGTEEYVKEFTVWFRENTTGGCIVKEK